MKMILWASMAASSAFAQPLGSPQAPIPTPLRVSENTTLLPLRVDAFQSWNLTRRTSASDVNAVRLVLEAQGTIAPDDTGTRLVFNPQRIVVVNP